MKRKLARKVIVGFVYITNVNVWYPTSIKGSFPMYTATILIPPTDAKALEGINMAIENTVQEGLLIHSGFRRASKHNLPLHSFVEDQYSPFHGYYVINASTFDTPSILDHKVFPITDHREVVNGSRVRVSLKFFPAKKDDTFCVGCKLGNIQKSVHKPDPISLPPMDLDWCHEEFLRILYESKLPT